MGQEYIKRGSVCSLVISSRGAKNILQHISDIRGLLKASIWSSLLRRQECFIRMWHGVRNSKLSFCWAFNLLYCNSKIIVYLSSIVCGCFLIFLQLKNLSRQITHAEWPLVFFSYTVWNDNGNVFFRTHYNKYLFWRQCSPIIRTWVVNWKRLILLVMLLTSCKTLNKSLSTIHQFFSSHFFPVSL